MALRALQKRVVKLEQARKPRPSPFTIWFGSIDLYVEKCVMPDIEAGLVDREYLELVLAIRRWEQDSHYAAWGLDRIWERRV